MKNKFKKLISALLVLTFVLSAFAVFAYAETEEGGEETPEKPTVFLNRTFDEGWDLKNGFSYNPKDNNYFVDHEETETYDYNYFARFEMLNSQDGYLDITFGTKRPESGGMVFEYSIMIDDYVNCSNIMYCRTPSTKTTRNMTAIKENALYLLDNKVCDLKGEVWVNVVFYFDFDNGTISACLKGHEDQLITMTLDETDKSLEMIRIGKSGASYEGMSYCLDNVKVYTGKAVTDISDLGVGVLADENAAKTVDIETGNGVSDAQLLANSLSMKLNVNYGLIGGKREPLFDGTYGAPKKIKGVVYVPLKVILDYLGYTMFTRPDGISFDISTDTGASYFTIGRDNVTVNGERVELTAAPGYLYDDDGENPYIVIAMDDVETLFPGKYITYDDMGLIILADKDNILNREQNLDGLVDIMKQFIFETVKGEDLYEDVKETTNNFTHPYIYTNQDRFDYLAEVYTSSEKDEKHNENLIKMMKSIVATANRYYNEFATLDDRGNYVKLDHKPVNPWGDPDSTAYKYNNGYDPKGGRLNESAKFNNYLYYWAYAYQITGDINYVKIAYDFALAMGEWVHWGPGHFLNCADATAPYAISFDWLFNAYEELGLSTDAIAAIIYEKGVYQGYLSILGKSPYPRSQGNASNFHTATNNWNAVCTSGMIIGSLAIMEYDEYKKERDYLVTDILANLPKYGLGQYAPDGSYVESAGYWAYGTNTFFKMVMALSSSAGTDYGFMNTWGIDKTCYFACQAESSDYMKWNYHDVGDTGIIDTSLFAFVGSFTGDKNLVALRQLQVANGKPADIIDTLFYSTDLDGADVDLELDYYMEGIDGFVTRSSWDKGAIYVGIMGGDNAASHAQVDSGSFIYYNKGLVWIADLGSDNYNVYGYFNNMYRYRYYKNNAEGANVVMISSYQDKIPYGQDLSGWGEITDVFTNEYGSYTIIDNTDVYPNLVTFANRGMLFTNNRSTVVIQDEISFVNITTAYWFAHTSRSITLSDDGKTAYLTGTKDGKTYTLRATLVSPVRSFKFTVMDCYTYVLKTTMPDGESEALGGVAEHSRKGYSKLVIEAEEVLSFEASVVFEMVESSTSKETVGYEFTHMDDWEPIKEFVTEDGNKIEKNRTNPKLLDIRTNTLKAAKYIEDGTAYGEDIDYFYNALTNVAFALTKFEADSLDETMRGYYKTYKKYLDNYNELRNLTVETKTKIESVNNKLMGF